MEKYNQEKINFEKIFSKCLSVVEEKIEKYGFSWRIFRPPSITDQIYIKAKRIRTVQEEGNLVEEDQVETITSIINYSIFHQIQRKLNPTNTPEDLNNDNLNTFKEYYNEIASETTHLMEKKNNDYGEAWRELRLTSITDLILVKLFRIKQLETKLSDGPLEESDCLVIEDEISSNYFDIINYSVFLLQKL